MTIRSLTTTYVDSAMALRHPSVRAAKVDELVSSGLLYIDNNGALNVRADGATAAQIEGQTLPTKVPAACLTLAQNLRILVDRGVITTINLHDANVVSE